MSQCVPSWDIEDNHAGTLTLCSNSSGRTEPLNDAPMSDYGVAELTWENGQLAMHALGPPRQPLKSSSTWDKLRATGTLESLVVQATNNNQLLLPLSSSSYHRGNQHPPKFEAEGGLVPWINLQRPSSASATVAMDALVPCSINTRTQSKGTNTNNMNMMVVGCSSTRAGSCSANRGQLDHRLACVPVASHGQDLSCSHDQSLSGCSANNNNHRLMRQQQQQKADLGVGFTRSGTTLDNSHNTSSDMPSPDDIDSLCHSSRPRHQREIDDDEDEEEEEEEHKKKKKASGGRDTKSSGSTKRTRAAAIHNQSERKRRDKINQRMKTLQKLVPNSSKTDKASMLDEVIEYLKQLQAQVHVMGRMNMPAPAPMMLPLAMQQQLQMSMMGPMGMGMGLGMGMGMGMGMDMNPMGRPNISPAVLHPSAFMAMNPASWGDHHHASADQRLQAPNALPDPLSAFLASQQSQPMSMEAYSRMAAMYQQLQQPQPHAPNSKS